MKRVTFLLIMIGSMCAQAQKVGISLSGGGALGFATLGFLQAMVVAGLTPDCIAGTSMGAIIGMMYAAGYSPQQIKEMAHKEKFDRISGVFRLDFRRDGGLMNTERIQKILLKYVPHNHFDSLHISFTCCSSDMNNLKPYYQNHGGNLVQYVMSSAAIPGIFAPVVVDSVYLYDGGFHDNLPVQPLLDEECDVRIGSYLVLEHTGEVKDLKKLWLHAYHYSSFSTAKANLPGFTHVVTIDPGDYWIDDFRKMEELYQIGYEAGIAYFQSQQTQVERD